ncbi:MAG: flavodoxin domain-containing protein [Anaerolineae bacterium]|nr:flavodoxin domain-containing protein [Anaerolineae bacterium]
MEKRLLVAYATRAGSTESIAEAVAASLRSEGFQVDVQPVRKVRSLAGYAGVIVGSAIRAGRPMPEAVSFVEKHEQELSRIPVAYFVVCLTMANDTEENRCTVAAYLDGLRAKTPSVKPVDVGLFPGVMDSRRLPFPIRLLMRAMKARDGDYRNWDAVREWAVRIAPAFR